MESAVHPVPSQGQFMLTDSRLYADVRDALGGERRSGTENSACGMSPEAANTNCCGSMLATGQGMETDTLGLHRTACLLVFLWLETSHYRPLAEEPWSLLCVRVASHLPDTLTLRHERCPGEDLVKGAAASRVEREFRVLTNN